jgi:hypothetical protein
MLSGAATTTNVVQAIKAGATDFPGQAHQPRGPEHGDPERAERRGDPARPEGRMRTPAPKTASRKAGWGKTCRHLAAGGRFGRAAADRRRNRRRQRGAGAPDSRQLSPRPQAVPEAELRRAAGRVGGERTIRLRARSVHRRFTSKPGKFELAQGGTILLDEIGDMDVRLQAKLLHVLQDKECERLGGKERISLDVRVMAATHCDLMKAIEDGRFRADLYYRLNVVGLRVPALRERKADIHGAAEFFLRKHGAGGRAVRRSRPNCGKPCWNTSGRATCGSWKT